MRTIWKTELEVTDLQRIQPPMDAKFLNAQVQKNKLVIWFECNPKAPTQERVIAIYGTGHNLPENPGKYISTFQIENGGLVFHVYELYGDN